MGKPGTFLDCPRAEAPRRPVEERLRDWAEVEESLPVEALREQAARCMDCGVPFCHSFGCPLANRVPDINDMVCRGQWGRALEIIEETNPFPEFTGHICPAPCEAACTLALEDAAVSTRQVERAVAEEGWRQGLIRPRPQAARSGKRVAVIGSGPAGLAAAQTLARSGHRAVVFEAADRPGGLLRYGIPDFKLPKELLDRRIEQLRAEGVAFELEVEAGTDMSARLLRRSFDAVLLAVGSRVARDIQVPGRDLVGILQALDFLTAQNRRNAGLPEEPGGGATAAGRHVVVIGGGDTGADCVGTSRRQGASSVTQLEILPEPPPRRAADNPWPAWPRVMRSSSSHEEGCRRMWGVSTEAFLGESGRVRALRCCRVDWPAGAKGPVKVPGSEFEVRCDLVLLAAGFLHAERGALVDALGLAVDARGNLSADAEGHTVIPGVFVAGDAGSGASLVVRAIASGLRAARAADAYLAGAG